MMIINLDFVQVFNSKQLRNQGIIPRLNYMKEKFLKKFSSLFLHSLPSFVEIEHYSNSIIGTFRFLLLDIIVIYI